MLRKLPSGTLPLAFAALLGVGVIGFGVFRGCEQSKERAEQRAARRAEDDKREAAQAAAAAADKVAYDAAVEKLLAAPPALEARCTSTLPMAPIKLGSMSLTWPSGPTFSGQPGDDTRGYLMHYVRFTGSNVAIVPAEASGAPFERVAFGAAALTLVVDRWVDPIVPAEVTEKSTFAVGELEGRVYAWDATAKQFTCGAQVTARNTDVTIVTTTNDRDYSRRTEDVLSKVRVDLVNEALRAGHAALSR